MAQWRKADQRGFGQGFAHHSRFRQGSDLYEDFALKPGNVQVLIRASANRNLVNGEKLFGYASSLPDAGRRTHKCHDPRQPWRANPRGASGASLRPRDDQANGMRHAKPCPQTPV